LECFAAGFETKTHFRKHPHVIIDCEPSPIFENDWSADLELIFLEAVMRWGFGNWEMISGEIRCKTPFECECHYFQTYLGPKPEIQVKSYPPGVESKGYPFTSQDTCAIDPDEMGYMPRRGEFGIEYHDEAESLLAELDITEFDTERSFSEKVECLVCYSGQVEARKTRTRLAEELKLGNTEPPPPEDSWMGREITGMIDPFCPIVGHAKAAELAELLKEQTALVTDVRMKEYWRQNGVVDLEEGKLFQRLQTLVVGGELQPEKVAQWNRWIEEYGRERGIGKDLNGQEEEICRGCRITAEFYCAAKDLLLREAMARGGLDRAMAIGFAPGKAEAMGEIYDYMSQVGWLDV
jgi:transcriptional adapter 2-alpha